MNAPVQPMLSYLLMPLLLIAQPEPAEQQLHYAENLFGQGTYDASILEYKRFLFYHPNTEMTDFARYRIAQSHYYQGNLGEAQRRFIEFMETHFNSPLYHNAQLMLGKTYLDESDYSTARSTFFFVHTANIDKRLSAQAQYLRGWCYAYDRNWLKAIAEFRQVDTILPNTVLSDTSMQIADTMLANVPLPLKSPQLAQWLSTFMPGAGQIYAGRVRNGLLSTAINATFFYLLVDALRDERYVDSVGICLVGFRFYWGNRSNAKQWAIERNRKLEADLIQKLKQQAITVEQNVKRWESEVQR